MNQQIKKLYLDASVLAHQAEPTDLIAAELVRTKKFAELIIKECADIAYEYDATKMSGPGMIIAGRIETHFGVEQ